ncbi:MAG TPA: hypothetical protein VK929_03525 [Longimicrobiales bacterium]|nr:hypothetical protein [Longimicrobiales bacterium]
MRSTRSILVAVLAFTMAAVPAAHAQQSTASGSAGPDPTIRLERVSPTLKAPEPASARVVAESRHENAETAAMREPSARTVLAVVGAAVLVIALIALIR